LAKDKFESKPKLKCFKSLRQLEKPLGGGSLFPFYPASLLPLEPFPTLHTWGAVQMLELDPVSTLAQG